MSRLTTKSVEYILTRSTQYIVNPMDLIKLIFAWEKRFFGDELKEDTAEAPYVHFFVIVAISEKALGSPVPTSWNVVGVGSGG